MVWYRLRCLVPLIPTHPCCICHPVNWDTKFLQSPVMFTKLLFPLQKSMTPIHYYNRNLQGGSKKTVDDFGHKIWATTLRYSSYEVWRSTLFQMLFISHGIFFRKYCWTGFPARMTCRVSWVSVVQMGCPGRLPGLWTCISISWT